MATTSHERLAAILTPVSNASIGTPADAEAAGDGTLIAVTKRMRSRLDLILAALGAVVIASGTVAIGNTPTVNQGGAPWSVAFPTAQPIICVTGCLGAGGGGIALQGARDITAQAWLVDGSAVTQPVSVTGVPNVTIDDWLGSTAPTVGQKTSANSLPMVIASDQSSVPVTATISGTPSVIARTSSATWTWVSLRSAAPAANAVQADTGALAAGTYDFMVNLMISDTVAVNKGLVIEHRNAANGATLFSLGGASPNGGAFTVTITGYTIATNERIRVIAGGAAGAASSIYVSAIGRRTAP